MIRKISYTCRGTCSRQIDEAIARLEGIDCRGKGTSCPDQLARALKTAR